jgi:hypothetical protein
VQSTEEKWSGIPRTGEVMQILESADITSPGSENVPTEEMPPLMRIVSLESHVLTRESILAKLMHEDVRKDLVSLANIPK